MAGEHFDVLAILAIADRLAQKEGGWKPFNAPLWARIVFPQRSLH